jgi:outer membrane receptor protein involved in Fe transport
MKTHRTSYPGLLFAAAIVIATVAPAGFAQVAPSTPPAPATTGPVPVATSSPSDISAAQADQVVTLSAFEVNGQGEHGYVASESETGTRIATKISDLPFSVNVVTSTFLNDFQEYDMNSQLAFVPGFTPSELDAQYQLNGFPQTVSLIDGFRRVGLVDTVDIDRIEVIHGPDASIYGATAPGGVINFLTPQPTTTQTDSLQFGGGSDNFYRAALYTSGPLGDSGKLFYRVDMSDQFNKYSEEFSSKHSDYIAGKLLYKPNADTSITLGVEHSDLYEHPFNQVLTVTEKQTMPWAANNITESQYYGMTTTGDLLDYNYAGPESYLHNRVDSATLILEHRFSDFWSLKFGANEFTNPYNDQMIGSGAYYPYGTGNITVTNGVVNQPFAPVVKDQPAADWKPQRGGGLQLDNLFSFNTGPIKNKLLITEDYYELTQRTVTQDMLYAVGTQATDYYALYSPYNPSGAPYYTPYTQWTPATMGYGWNTTMYNQNPSLYTGTATDSWLADGDYGLFGSERATMFDDRLILMVGGRYDYVKNQVKNYNLAASGSNPSLGAAEPTNFQAFDYNTSDWTYQMGASFKVTDGVNLFANKSTAFNPQPQIDTVTGLALPNNTSNGYEFGFKADLLKDRLNIEISRFLINEYNLAVTETDPVTGIKDTILNGQEQSKGYEGDVNYQVTSDFYVQADWGYAVARTINGYALTFYDALPVRRVPTDNVGMAIRYQFSRGPVKGLFLTADAKYYSKSLVNLGSGKSLIPGPASATSGSTLSMYYVAATNTTYAYAAGTDPKISGELKLTATPFNNVPLPGNGLLPYPNQPANALINFPVGQGGTALPLVNPAVPGVYSGEPTGVYVDDGRSVNFNAPYAVFDVGVGYTHFIFHRDTATFQVGVKNLLNRAYTYGSGVPGAPFQVVGTCTFNF